LFEKNVRILTGVASAEADSSTASTLIHFDENMIARNCLIIFLKRKGYYILSKAKTMDEVLEQAAEKAED